ncbi:MAG: alpha-E domain-containing protein [Gemmiger sp.]
MGAITLSKANRLFWLGRYLERVYTTITATRSLFDAYTDGVEGDFHGYCRALGIPDDYRDTADFIQRYYFDAANPHSIAASLDFAYDNAIVLRETISTDTLAYVQMADSAMELASGSAGPGVELQWVLDDIMAFRGSCEEQVDDETSRNIIKTGSSLERVDLYLRLNYDDALCEKEFHRLFNRLYKAKLDPDRPRLNLLVDAMLDNTQPVPPRSVLVTALEGLFSGV